MKLSSIFRTILNENENILSPDYYLEDFYEMDFNDEYEEKVALAKIQKTIDWVMNLNLPITIYRGVGADLGEDEYMGGSWSTSKEVAEGFGKTIYVGILHDKNAIDIEQTIRTRVMNPEEHELYISNFNDVKLINTYKK